MFNTLIRKSLHLSRTLMGATDVTRSIDNRERVVDIGTLEKTKPLTKEEIAEKYKKGRVAEMSDVHAGN